MLVSYCTESFVSGSIQLLRRSTAVGADACLVSVTAGLFAAVLWLALREVRRVVPDPVMAAAAGPQASVVAFDATASAVPLLVAERAGPRAMRACEWALFGRGAWVSPADPLGLNGGALPAAAERVRVVFGRMREWPALRLDAGAVLAEAVAAAPVATAASVNTDGAAAVYSALEYLDAWTAPPAGKDGADSKVARQIRRATPWRQSLPLQLLLRPCYNVVPVLLATAATAALRSVGGSCVGRQWALCAVQAAMAVQAACVRPSCVPLGNVLSTSMYCVTAAGFALLGLHTAAGLSTVSAAEVSSLVVTGLGTVSSVRAATTFGIKFAQAFSNALGQRTRRNAVAFQEAGGWHLLGDALLLSSPQDECGPEQELCPTIDYAAYGAPGVFQSTSDSSAIPSFADAAAALVSVQSPDDINLLDLPPPAPPALEIESTADWVARGHFTGYGLDEGEADWAAPADGVLAAAAPVDHLPGHRDAEAHHGADDDADDDDALQAMHYERHEYEGAAALDGLLADEATCANPLAPEAETTSVQFGDILGSSGTNAHGLDDVSSELL
jgi:hypothetical protein